jgi:hypothetical protein
MVGVFTGQKMASFANQGIFPPREPFNQKTTDRKA